MFLCFYFVFVQTSTDTFDSFFQNIYQFLQIFEILFVVQFNITSII